MELSRKYIFIYTVCWRESAEDIWEWRHRNFLVRKEAEEFARGRGKECKSGRPSPYIVQSVTRRDLFRGERCEACDLVFRSDIERFRYRKCVRYRRGKNKSLKEDE